MLYQPQLQFIILTQGDRTHKYNWTFASEETSLQSKSQNIKQSEEIYYLTVPI